MSERTITFRLGRVLDRMRYKTVGDYVESPNGVEIIVADLGDPRYENLVALHELVELFLCQQAGVTMAQIDTYDFSHQADDDPGLNPASPYHVPHMVALAHEIHLCAAFGLNWTGYNAVLDETWERIPEKKPEGER